MPKQAAEQLGGWFYDNMPLFSLKEIKENELSDEDRLRRSDEMLPDEQSINKSQHDFLLEKLDKK